MNLLSVAAPRVARGLLYACVPVANPEKMSSGLHTRTRDDPRGNILMSATYPRRWLVAIVFASIVALTAGSFTDVWAASNGGTGGSLPSELATVELDVAEIIIRSQGTRTFSATSEDVDGDAVSGVTLVYSIVSGGGSINSSSGAFTAPSGPGTVVVKVVATQGELSADDTATVTVRAPSSSPAPTAVPQNPSADVPSPPPPSTAGGAAETITPAEGGSVSIETTGTDDEPGRNVVIDVPSSAVDDFVTLDVAPVPNASVPPVPAALRVRVSGTVVDLTFSDTDGNPIDDFVAGRAITITISYTQADADEAGGAQNLVIMKYDEIIGEWVALPTTPNFAAQTISASVKTFSLFGVGIPEVGEPAVSGTATPVSGVSLPATGDVAPGNNAVIAFIVLGLLLMTGGVTVMRRLQVSRIRG